MKQYVINCIQNISDDLHINISEFYNIINEKYMSEYGINFKFEAEDHGMDMIQYADSLDKIDYSFLFRLLSMANKINNEYKGDK